MAKSRKVTIENDGGLVTVGEMDVEGLLKAIDEWMQEDDEDQRETFEVIKKGIDENRPEGYKHFS
jgi:uncharacterized linocin/CFP29 family protein